MGMKKSKAMMLLGMAAAFSGEYPDIDESIETVRKRKPLTEKEKQEIEDKINSHKGLSKFNYEGGYVWALNQKSADKKAKKKGII